MTAIVYQYNEAPLVFDDIEELRVEGNDLTIVNHDGELPIDLNEIIRVELTND